MTILEKIFETKRAEVQRSMSLTSPEEMRHLGANMAMPLGFLKALRADHTRPALIAEVKKASPSQGEIIAGHFDPVAIAKVYEENGAACLSVLTDVDYFQGSPDYLVEVRKAVGIPLLRKDFIFDEYQLDEARAWGADCVLLIVAGLDENSLKHLNDQAKARGLDVLVEVHNEAETEIALRLAPEMIGINNRDLATFETDITTTKRLIEMIPDHIFTVSESALHTNGDVNLVKSYGATAVLIGTAFCGAADIGSKVREVMGR